MQFALFVIYFVLDKKNKPCTQILIWPLFKMKEIAVFFIQTKESEH